MSKVVTKPIVLNTKESLDVRLPKHGKFFTKKSGKDLLVFEEGSDIPVAVYENYELSTVPVDLASLPHYAELSTEITGVTTDAVIGSGAAATTSAAVAGTATAATGTGLSTMAMVGIGAVGVGGAAAVANSRSGGSSSVPVAPADTTAPSLAITSLAITNSTTPTISGTAEAGSVITLTIAGATYTATTAIDGIWSVDTAGIPSSGTFTLDPNGDNSVSVTATDAAGNVSVAATQTLLVDTTAPVTAGFTFTDAGVSATDGLSSNPAITLTLASDTAAWQYSLDNGTTWVNGSGSSITLAEGTYDKQDVQVKQFDAAGNSSISHMSTTPTLAPLTMVQLEALGNTTGNDDAPQITAVGTAGEYVVTFYGADSAGYRSIFVQKFNADGTTAGTMVQLEALNKTTGYDQYPQITAVGTTGEYVVTFSGTDSANDDSIFVQKFNADGTTTGNAMIQLEALGNTTGYDQAPQITSVGTAGEYVVTFYGRDSDGDDSIFVQKFNADGTTTGNAMVQLEALGTTTASDRAPQITAVGTTGEYVVTFYGNDGIDNSIFVQKFNSDGTTTGNAMVQLEALGNPLGNDYAPQITAVGTVGEYVVTFYGIAGDGYYSIFVQKFNADGTVQGAMVQLEASGNTTSFEYPSQITAVGTTGEYVVTFEGRDSAGDYSIFVQKFNADGTVQGTMVQLEALGNATGDDYGPQITAVGMTGEYVVTFEGEDANGDYSIFVQKFDANGAAIGTMSQINVPNASNDSNWGPQIIAVGTAGEFAVTFTGIDSNGDASIFVQKFRADGTYAADMSNTMMIDTTAPTATMSALEYTITTDTLVITGLDMNTIAANGTDIKSVLDWSQLTWNIDGDTVAATTAETFASGDILSATVTSDTQLTIVFSNDKAIALEATTGFNTGATDNVDILAGFLRDTAGNVDMATYNTAVVYA
jgi:roadblock/LC7 domain-containing protein